MGCELARRSEAISAEARPGKLARQNCTRDSWGMARRLEHALKVMTRAVEKADLLAKRGRKTPLEVLQTIASHNSYHLGQVVVLRQRLCAWPPPSGGLTWQLPAERKSHDCRLAGDASA